jgi:hypothetical protein
MEGRTPVPSLPASYGQIIPQEIDLAERSLIPMRASPEQQQEFTKTIIGLSVLFPIKDMGEDGFALRQGLLNHLFADYPIEMIREACLDYAKTGEWFPRPKDLIERIERLVANRKTEITKLNELLSKIEMVPTTPA